MSYETILYDVAETGVATLTLNRPDRLNAFTIQMAKEVADVWSRARDDDAVRAIVMRAAGDRAFCTGIDVAEKWSDRDKTNPFDRRDDPFVSPKAARLWKPIICAIHGMAAGGAFFWINDSDIAICSEDAQFFDPHVTVGMVASLEPTGLIGRIHLGEILRWVLMGNDERLSAETALRIGLVSEIVPRDRLWARADEIATLIARKSPVAVQGSLRAIWEALDLPRSTAMANALRYTQLGSRIDTPPEPPGMPKRKWTLR